MLVVLWELLFWTVVKAAEAVIIRRLTLTEVKDGIAGHKSELDDQQKQAAGPVGDI